LFKSIQTNNDPINRFFCVYQDTTRMWWSQRYEDLSRDRVLKRFGAAGHPPIGNIFVFI
jgi:hypothetical protein